MLLRSGFLLLYSLIFVLLAPLARLLACFSPKIRGQLASRQPVAGLAPELARARSRKRHGVVFFCSSAGEYEQARPLIDRLSADDTVYIHVLFFSQSGCDFVKARGDLVAATLIPASDSIWQWGWLFSALRPDIVVVVRHELWPGFLDTARRFARGVYLIDASRSLGETTSRAKRYFRARLLNAFTSIYTVSEADRAFFLNNYRLPPERLQTVGDTKYDRVRERAQAKAGESRRLREFFDGLDTPPRSKARRRLVLGSAYRQEVELALAARRLLGAQATLWQFVIAPHHVAELTPWILERCQAEGLRAIRYTDLKSGAAQDSTYDGAPEVIVLDTMGMLSEVYGTAEAAFVGGALHRQVHNVLEPACHGLALAYGPFYKNSQEAVHLARSGLADIVSDAAAFAAWLEATGRRLSAGEEPPVARALDELAGASGRILADWRSILGPKEEPKT